MCRIHLKEVAVNLDLTRRGFLGAAAAGLAAGEPLDRPNILWICTDQQRWDTIHALGNRHIRTPHVDSLAESGVAFTHAHCPAPICTPSRASFLTGYYPCTVHGCMNGNEAWEDAKPLITRTLADAGYDCGLAGKLHLSAANGRVEPRPDDGYRVFHWSHHPADDWPEGHAYKDWLTSRGVDYWTTHRRLGYIPTEHHQTTWCAEMAMDFMKEKRRGPWLMSLNCFDPHPPLDPPAEYLERFDVESLPGPLFRETDLAAQKRLENVCFQSKGRRPEEFNGKLMQAKYWAQIELIDDQVGRMLRCLDETGQRENTIIIFTSDHGETCGDHGLTQKGCRFYESLVRVPLIISWPKGFQAGKRSGRAGQPDGPAANAAGDRGPCPGRRRCADDRCCRFSRGNRIWRRASSCAASSTACCKGPQSYATMIRTHNHKLVNYHGTGLGELFDLTNDPDEFDNLWDSPVHADIRFELMEQSFDELAFATDVGSPRIGRY